MYPIIVLLLMLLLPFGSVYVEHSVLHASAPLMALVGKWYVFWAAGVRLFTAGIRQQIQPQFTAREIFHFDSDDVLPVVRELGVANFATGAVAIASLFRPDFVLPLALIAGLFYGIAGIRHVGEKSRTANENIALVSDLFAFIVFAAYAAYALCLV